MEVQEQSPKHLDAEAAELIAYSFRSSQKRLILLDYDGTLVPYACEPSKALPDAELLKLLEKMSAIAALDLVIISGRHSDFLNEIFGNLDVNLFAEHGAIFRINGVWESLGNDTSWKDEIMIVMNDFIATTPGSSIEVKQNSLVWHYRKSASDLADSNAALLIARLAPICTLRNLSIMKGRKIVEVKPSEYTKGSAIINFFDCSAYDFILAAGDDVTDEDLFEALPEGSFRIHIGKSSEIADYTMKNSVEFVTFLQSMITTSEIQSL